MPEVFRNYWPSPYFSILKSEGVRKMGICADGWLGGWGHGGASLRCRAAVSKLGSCGDGMGVVGKSVSLPQTREVGIRNF